MELSQNIELTLQPIHPTNNELSLPDSFPFVPRSLCLSIRSILEDFSLRVDESQSAKADL